MKLQLKNIGPINNIEISTDADLIFIYGKNNIGKSYAITLLYLILKNYMLESSYLGQWRFPVIKPDIKDIFEKINSIPQLDITEFMNTTFSKLMNNIFTAKLTDSLKSSFGDLSNLNNKISNKNLEICLSFDDFYIYLEMKDNTLVTKCHCGDKKFLCKKAQQHFSPQQTGDAVMFYCQNEEQFIQDIHSWLFSFYQTTVSELAGDISNVYYLPASRSGLYRSLSAFSHILAELARKRSFLNEKIVLPSISEQDADYFSMITEINTKRINPQFNSVATSIEKKLLKGEVNFDQRTKQIIFHPDDVDVNLELLSASSMIAEISPIVLYLRYIVKSSGDIKRKDAGTLPVPVIFIEEPEAHLHPETQVQLIECFIDLARSGAKLVITSHSNYIFNKLNNLIAKKCIAKEKVVGYFFYQTDLGSCSNIIKIGDLGMQDDNFIDIAEKLYDEKLEIIESLMEQ
jgi:predicted ATPase